MLKKKFPLNIFKREGKCAELHCSWHFERGVLPYRIIVLAFCHGFVLREAV